MIGVRAAFFVPSELPAAWAFRSCAPDDAVRFWRGTRSAMAAFVLRPVLVVCALLAPVIGARPAALHAAFVSALAFVMVEVASLTFRGIPFTRPYEPGRAKLKTRWPWYIVGVYAVAYWPARYAVWMLEDAVRVAFGVGMLAAVAVVLEVAARPLSRRWSLREAEPAADEFETVTVLSLGGAAGVSS